MSISKLDSEIYWFDSIMDIWIHSKWKHNFEKLGFKTWVTPKLGIRGEQETPLYFETHWGIFTYLIYQYLELDRTRERNWFPKMSYR